MAASNKSGSIIIELVLAIALFSVTVTSLASITFDNRMAISKNTDDRESLFMAESNLENSLAFDNSPPEGSVIYFSPCEKEIKSSSQSIELKAALMDIKYAKAVGGDCGGYPPRGDWSLPTISTANISSALDSARALDISGNVLFIGTESADHTESNILSLQADDYSSLSELSIPQGLNAFDAAGRFVYVAAKGISDQFKIIDASDPRNMTLAASISLPGVSGSYPSGLSIFYYQSRVYIGTHRTAGNEFHIFDVSDPYNPVWLGSIELNHNINAVAVRFPYAYLATSGNIRDVIILDISNPSVIQRISVTAFLGTEDAISANLIGNILYVGRKRGTAGTHPEFIALDVSDSTLPAVAGSLYINADIISMRILGSYAFLALTRSSWPFQILNIRDLTNIMPMYKASFSPPAAGIDYKDNKIFLILENTELKTLSTP